MVANEAEMRTIGPRILPMSFSVILVAIHDPEERATFL